MYKKDFTEKELQELQYLIYRRFNEFADINTDAVEKEEAREYFKEQRMVLSGILAKVNQGLADIEKHTENWEWQTRTNKQ